MMHMKKMVWMIKAMLVMGGLATGMPTRALAQLITTPNQVIDCGQVLFRKPVTVHFELTNEGQGSITIKKVETSCGCTEVNFPKGIITENKPFIVSATFDAKQMGHFEKYIDIFTQGASLPFTLTMKGVVVEEVKDYGGEYQYVLGKLKTDRKEIFFDDVEKGENPVAEIHVLNTTSEMANPNIMHLPPYLKADVSPSAIPPGKSGVIYLTLRSDRMDDFGLTQTAVYLGFKPGDKISEDKQIPITAILLPSFGMVTEQQMVYMPKLRISDTTLDLGEFAGKKKKKGTLVIENLGRTDLEISKIQTFTEGLEIELTDKVIQPGSSAKLKVTADQKVLKGVKRTPQILLISNDPRTPKVIVDINVK